MDIYQIENYKFRAEQMRDQNLAVGLLTSHYIPVNIWLIRYLGLDAALFLSAVFEELFYLKEIGKATYYVSDVKFSVRKAQMKTGLGETRQRKAIKVLESHNLLKAYNTGWVPSYRNISFNFSGFRAFENELNNFINKETTKSKKTKEEFEKKMKGFFKKIWAWILKNKIISIVVGSVLAVGITCAIALPIALKHKHDFN